MGNEINTFENPEFGMIRTMKDDKGEPWFVGKDVAMALGYLKPLNAIAIHVEQDDSLKQGLIDSLGRKQDAIFINESGLYSLILSSKLESAKKFKRWVTSIVLPQIRKTGGYIPQQEGENDNDIMARALLIAQKTIADKNHALELKQKQLDEQKPLVDFAEAVVSQNDSILIGELAKLITQNGVEIGQKRLFKWLRLNGYLFKNKTTPIQKWVEKGLFDITVTVVETEVGDFERLTTKVTGKGQQYFMDGFTSGKFKI